MLFCLYAVIPQRFTASCVFTQRREMEKWVELAKLGRSSQDVIPVNVPATPEWAEQLDQRLRFLETDILPWFQEDEVERS